MYKIKNKTKTFKKLLTIFWPFVAFGLITLYVCRGFLFKPGYILFGEFIGSTDFTFFLKDALKPWSDYTILGHSSIGFPTTYGLHPAYLITPQRGFFWFGLLSLLQVIFSASGALKAYVILELVVPFLGMYVFALFWFEKYKKDKLLYKTLAFIAGTIYTLNAAVGDRVFAGHLFYPLGYGFLPLYLFFLCKFILEVKNSKKIAFLLLSGISFSLLLWMMPHLIIFALFFLGLYFLLFVMGNKKKTQVFIIGGFLSAIIGFLLNVHLWLPALFFPESYPFFHNSEYILLYAYNTAPYVTFDKILTLSSTTEKMLLLTDGEYKNLFVLRLILSFLALILLIVNKDRKKFILFFLLAAFGIIFGMGVNYPFEKFYGFLYEHIFLFEPFRDTSKFVIMYVFSLSLILPTLFIYLYKFLGKWILFAVFLFVVFLLYINPMFSSGNFAGNIEPFIYPNKYDVLKEFLAKDKDYYRVAIYPNNEYIGSYNWYPKLPNSSIHPTIFTSLTPLNKGLIVSNSTVSNYSSQYLDYIEANLDKEWAINRLGLADAKYIIVDPSMKGYEKNLQALQNNPAVSQINAVSGFDIFLIKNFENAQIQKRNAVYYFGDMKGLQYVPSDISFINLGQNPITVLSRNYSSSLLLFNSSLNDLFLTSLYTYRFSFFPEVRFSDGTTSFIISGENIRDSIKKGINFYNPQGIVSGGVNKIEKKSQLKPGTYKLFLSVLSFTQGSEKAKIKIGAKSVTKNIEKKKEDTLIWIDFGTVLVNESNPNIEIYNAELKYLVVDSLLIVPEKEYAQKQKMFASLIQNKKIITLDEQADISGLENNKKQIYVMPQSYSPYWGVCGSQTFLVDFYATGTTCKNNTAIKPNFKPEKLFYLSVVLTGVFYIAICGCILYFIFLKRDKKKRKLR